MNIYFLVEGEHTERKFYDRFVQHYFEGRLTRVERVHEAERNQYFILSAAGYPKVFTTVFPNAIKDIRTHGAYQHLIVCIDTDEHDHDYRQKELSEYIEKCREDGVGLPPACQLHLITQQCCIETWFLGNRDVYKANPQDKTLVEYQQFYNVSTNDPEKMGVLPRLTKRKVLRAQFHEDYLKRMTRERNIRYTKKMPSEVLHVPYFKAMEQRVHSSRKTPPDLHSFARFLQLCDELKQKL